MTRQTILDNDRKLRIIAQSKYTEISLKTIVIGDEVIIYKKQYANYFSPIIIEGNIIKITEKAICIQDGCEIQWYPKSSILCMLDLNN